MALPRWMIFLFLFLLCFVSESVEREEHEEEEFSEELFLKPLPDRKVLAHFHFQSRVPPTETYGRHHHLFPKAIYQLVTRLSLYLFNVLVFDFVFVLMNEYKWIVQSISVLFELF